MDASALQPCIRAVGGLSSLAIGFKQNAKQDAALLAPPGVRVTRGNDTALSWLDCTALLRLEAEATADGSFELERLMLMLRDDVTFRKCAICEVNKGQSPAVI